MTTKLHLKDTVLYEPMFGGRAIGRIVDRARARGYFLILRKNAAEPEIVHTMDIISTVKA